MRAPFRARLVTEDDHQTIATGEADLYFDVDDYQGRYGDGAQEQLPAFLRLREGLPVFRADAAPEGH
ncbi:hypothetical protein [Streptomyces sp. BE147]|uniref:hypothetical protein n=1 Tax=unclassified Streptomyces TaxID=2593676 RepID=UPI002E768E7B|nr:hypothetical protein [Streptomyces sp. BE147]MEE1735126.1 hypothetical protein [Streptomyces sp. BE147]